MILFSILRATHGIALGLDQPPRRFKNIFMFFNLIRSSINLQNDYTFWQKNIVQK